jgi:hypothetical protein
MLMIAGLQVPPPANILWAVPWVPQLSSVLIDESLV